MKTATFSKPNEVRDRLTELGLNPTVFVQSIQRMQVIATSLTTNHPPIIRGILPWGEVVATLRELLIPKGWTRDDSENLSLTVNQSRTVAIVVATGDSATGNPELSPSTRSSKGPMTQSAVIVNALQLDLFGNVRLSAEELQRFKGIATFILLFYRDTTSQETRLELSRPIKMDQDGHPIEWSERIILPPVAFGGDETKASTEQPQATEILPEVKRKRE